MIFILDGKNTLVVGVVLGLVYCRVQTRPKHTYPKKIYLVYKPYMLWSVCKRKKNECAYKTD